MGISAPKSASPVNASVSGNVGSNKIEADNRASSINLGIDYARDAVLSARAEAVAAAREHFGTFTDANEAEVRALILRDTRIGIETRMGETRDAALEEISGARAGHDVEPEFAVEQRELRDGLGSTGDQVSTRHGIIRR